MKKDDRTYIEHILRCIADIERYLGGDKKLFLTDLMHYDATLRKLQIMAESATKLSEKAKQAMPEIAWRQIAGLRNILVHDYLGDLDSEKIWRVIEERLPELKHNI